MDANRAGQLYDMMEPDQKDMPRHEFINKVINLTDPKRFREDLDDVIKKKQEFRTRSLLAMERKKKIDEVVS